MIRIGRKYSIDEVLSKVQFVTKVVGKKSKVNFDGDLINVASDRLKLFATKGVKCVKCDIEGKYFVKERVLDESCHFNLYGINDLGEEILMTKDHIFPKSLGGKDEIDNYQTMCIKCNVEKGKNLP